MRLERTNCQLRMSPDGNRLLIEVQIPIEYILGELPENAPQTIDRLLTRQELLIFNLVRDCNVTVVKELSSKMNLSVRTTKYHLCNIYRKLGVHGILGLVERYKKRQQVFIERPMPVSMAVSMEQPVMNRGESA